MVSDRVVSDRTPVLQLATVTCITKTLVLWALLRTLCTPSYAEVFVQMSSSCDGQADSLYHPLPVCTSQKVILICCTKPASCVQWTGQWWYKNVSDPSATFQKYEDNAQSVWVYANDTQHPVRYLCNVSSSNFCEGGSGYIDLIKGASPSIAFANSTDSDSIEVTEQSSVTLLFEVYSYPPPTSIPQLIFNNSVLPSQWHYVFAIPDTYEVLPTSSLNNVTHFVVELSVEKFSSVEHNGVYSVIVENYCGQINKNVSIKAKCQFKDTVKFSTGALVDYYHYHTVEGRNVTFSYGCYGTNVINWWAVDGLPLSPYDYSFSLSDMHQGCITILSLTLLNVTLNYSSTFTAYPSTSVDFSTTGINATVNLAVHRYPRLSEVSPVERDGDTVYLKCSFSASNYLHLTISEWRKTKQGVPIEEPPRFSHRTTWFGHHEVLIELKIMRVTPEDSGSYFCSLRYNGNIMNGSEVISDYGKVDLHIGSAKTNKLLIVVICVSVVGVLLIVVMLLVLAIVIKRNMDWIRSFCCRDHQPVYQQLDMHDHDDGEFDNQCLQ